MCDIICIGWCVVNNGKGCLLALNSYFILPAVIFFTIMWFLFGGFNGSETKYIVILISCLFYIVISIGLGFKYVYNFANSGSSSKERKIFFIGIILLVIALFVFFKFIMKR